MAFHAFRRLAQISAIATAAIASSLGSVAHAAGIDTPPVAPGFAYDVSQLMGGGSLRFSDGLTHSLLTTPMVTVTPIVVSGDGTGMVAAPITSLSGPQDTPNASPQVVERLSLDLRTGTLFGYLASGAAVSLPTAIAPLAPVPKPSASTPPSLGIDNILLPDLGLYPMYDSLVGQPMLPRVLVWQTANGTMQSTIALDVSPVPEAGSLALMALGLVGMGLLNLRRNR